MIHEQRPTTLLIPKPSPLDSPRIMHGQKPVDLAKTIVLTLNPGDVVLDFCTGSGIDHGVACYLTGRQFIGMKCSTHYVLGTRRLQALVKLAGCNYQGHSGLTLKGGVTVAIRLPIGDASTRGPRVRSVPRSPLMPTSRFGLWIFSTNLSLKSIRQPIDRPLSEDAVEVSNQAVRRGSVGRL